MKKLFFMMIAFATISCQSQDKKSNYSQVKEPIKIKMTNEMEIATFAGGCFWCTEAIFLELKGVEKVLPGYIGGTVQNPTYKEVCNGTTGHAEAIQITFNPKIISFGELLEIFFATHDPTTLNRQGNDEGTQYRSEVFYYTDNQKQLTQDYIALMTTEKTFKNPIVTRVSPASEFFIAEDYHQNYYNLNKTQSYCSYVITPKIEKLKKNYKQKLKSNF
ncbi:MAG TPA: peptide-methionine (S)-S-oxide reductase MsrA [Flavobacterium sp.]|jgi:peptide-methionine (S)-S-oxide reductase|nr:peptide-methionine (S)-S-oxide reductase MsrA [Flavobacterium sp.]HQX02813.1 peptide-methionine (S)-S-oxide reductase MsrA [Flavobacterium sp.]